MPLTSFEQHSLNTLKDIYREIRTVDAALNKAIEMEILTKKETFRAKITYYETKQLDLELMAKLLEKERSKE